MSNLLLLVLLAVLVEFTNQQSNSFECGLVKVKTVDTIIRGHEASVGGWPWHAAINHRDYSKTEYACGGTLISSLFVLTAAHCVMDNNGQPMSPKRVTVTLGMHDRHSVNTRITQNHNAQQVHLYQDAESSDRNDIALVELSTSVTFTDYIQPACLNKNRNLTGLTGTVPGWGITEFDEVSTVLRIVELPAIDSLECLSSDRETHGQMLDKSLFCAGHMESRAVCNGDSGGGLVFKTGDRWYVGGIVSYSALREGGTVGLCRRNGYAGVSRTFHRFLPWIHETAHIPSMDETQEEGSCSRQIIHTQPSARLWRLLPRNCGPYLINHIVGGRKAKLFEFPWMATVHDRTEKLCAGSLISKRYVLIVASRLLRRDPQFVRLGEYKTDSEKDCSEDNPDDCAPPVQDIDIEEIKPHPKFSVHSKTHDIALVRLARNVEFADHIQPICLPVTPELQSLSLPRYTFAGWGKTNPHDQEYSSTLMKAVVLNSDLAMCLNGSKEVKNLDTLSGILLCAGGGEAATCHGDAGGPLGQVAQFSNGHCRFVQFGILSRGSASCGTQAIYTKVSHFVDWIVDNMRL